MKRFFQNKGKRVLSAFLCALMAISALPMSAFAWTSEEGKSCASSFGDYYVGSDGEYYRSKSSYSFKPVSSLEGFLCVGVKLPRRC